MSAKLILVRHAAVADEFQGRCYGQSDVELSEPGKECSRELAQQLSTLPITHVVHSGMQRTRYLAERLAAALGQDAGCCKAIRERNFGKWELETWDALHHRFGDEMLKVVSDPETFRPGGGDTTFEMRDRVLGWFDGLPASGITVAVTHGGPIAALLGSLERLPVESWPKLIPACGEYVSLNLN